MGLEDVDTLQFPSTMEPQWPCDPEPQLPRASTAQRPRATPDVLSATAL